MKTLKLTALFAAISMAAGVAMAQPPTTGTQQEQRHRPPAERSMRGDQGGSPAAKLRIAGNLDSLTTEQKSQIAEFAESKKSAYEEFQKEMQEAMETARQSGDRQARRQAMQPVRQKLENLEQEVDTFLQGLLSQEQMQELKSQTQNIDRRGRMGRRSDDQATTDSRRGRRGDRRRGMQSRDAGTTASNAATAASNVRSTGSQLRTTSSNASTTGSSARTTGSNAAMAGSDMVTTSVVAEPMTSTNTNSN